MKKAIEVGTAGRNVAANVARLRVVRGMSFRVLAEAVTAAGRPLNADALCRMENGARPDAKQVRRVDVDDLVALALALGVEPHQLLMRPSDLTIEVRIGTGGEGR